MQYLPMQTRLKIQQLFKAKKPRPSVMQICQKRKRKAKASINVTRNIINH
jgi:hypothetical protein